LEIKAVRPSIEDSIERLCHHSEAPHFILCLRNHEAAHNKALLKPRLERAIGVIYRPESELAGHYFQAILPGQFDEYVWFDESRAVSPIKPHELKGLPDTYPFGV
jgi:erythromycin esterase-like protein